MIETVEAPAAPEPPRPIADPGLPPAIPETPVLILTAEALSHPLTRPSVPLRSWFLAMCAGVILGAVITLALVSRPSQQVHAHAVLLAESPKPPEAAAFGAADRAAPTPLAPVGAEPAPVSKAPREKPERKQPPSKQSANPAPAVRPQKNAIPRQLPPPLVTSELAAPLPPPPAVVAAPLSIALDPPLNPMLPETAPPPAPSALKSKVYAGPRQGRLIWTGNLGRHGVIEVDGARATVGSLAGALPGQPLTLRVSPAEFGHDGLVAFTGDRARDGATEAPAKANGWNGAHFKFDATRARELVLLEAPNPSNDFKRLVLRNDGRPCTVVIIDWTVN